MKKLKRSERGLTFSLEDASKIGTKFRYFIDKEKSEIVIVADASGKGTVSRKKSGERYKALYDIRSQEVKNLVSEADYMEVEEHGNKIVVHVYKKISSACKIIKSNIVSIQDVLCAKTGEIVLKNAVGTELFGHATLANNEYFEYLVKTMHVNNQKAKKEQKKLNRVYDTISLFSGAGLLDYAFKDPRIRFVFANDACIIDGKFHQGIADTYEYNIGHKMTVGDIRQIDASTLPNADIVIGGPCCQAYSQCNHNNQDTEEAEAKRLLVDDYARIVKEKQPKVFVIENVPELLTKEQGKYIDRVINALPEYEISCTVLKDDRIGGFSTRKRAIVIGSKIGKIELPDKQIMVVRTVRDALKNVDCTWFNWNDASETSEAVKERMKYVPQGGNYLDIPVDKRVKGKFSNSYRRLSWDAPSCTITNWRKNSLTHPDKDRTLNVAEAAAIMGLDKNFHFFGSVATMQQSCGNGVTQAMGKFVKEEVLKALDAFYKITPMPVRC